MVTREANRGLTRRGFALTLAVAPAALAAGSAQERGRQIVEKTIDALGGDGFRNMTTRSETGRAYSFYHEQLNGLSVARLYTRYLAAEQAKGSPQVRLVERQVLGKKQEDSIILTAKEGYEVTFRGAKPLSDDRISQFRESTLHDFLYILRERLDEPGLEFEARGADVTENQPVETLDIYDSENRMVTVWINSDTWLPAKQRYYRWDPLIGERREEVTRYSRYRAAGDGVTWPHSVSRERDTEKIFEMYAEEVKVNQPLADSLFELPRGIKMLSK
jgi:hypothetical protein